MDAKALAEVQEKHTRVMREELLDALKKNKDTHKKEYDIAIVGWRKLAVVALKMGVKKTDEVIRRMESDIKEEKPVKQLDVYKLQPKVPRRPEDHTKEYEALIRRLDMSADEHIYITHDDFNCYVLDEWNWKGSHTEMLNNYSSPGVFTQTNYTDD